MPRVAIDKLEKQLFEMACKENMQANYGSKVAKAYRALDAALATAGKERLECKADGDCQFRALVRGKRLLGHKTPGHAQVKQLIRQELVDNFFTYSPFIEGEAEMAAGAPP